MLRPRSLLLVAIGIAVGACAHVERAAPAAKGDRVYATGSHIAQRADASTGLHATAPVSVYSRANLDATGRPQLADALLQLDPSVSR